MRRRPVELSNNFDAAIHLIVACLFVGQRRKYAELRKAMDECIYIYVYVCVYIYIYIYIYIKICAYVALFSSRGSLHERAQMAALCLVLCHLVDKYVTQVAVLTEKGGRNKGLKSLEERKKAFKDEYKKRGFPP